VDVPTLTLIGTIAAIAVVLLTILLVQLQRHALAGPSPKLLVTIDYTPGNEPLEVYNAEGQTAYRVRLDKFAFAANIIFEDKEERFYCRFETINHLTVNQRARIVGPLEDP
jgi:hypothetical protein